MTNNSVETYLKNAEGVFEIDLYNVSTGTPYDHAAVTGENTLGQILKAYGADIGADTSKDKVLFINKRTGRTYVDKDLTVSEIGLMPGDKLGINDDGVNA